MRTVDAKTYWQEHCEKLQAGALLDELMDAQAQRMAALQAIAPDPGGRMAEADVAPRYADATLRYKAAFDEVFRRMYGASAIPGADQDGK